MTGAAPAPETTLDVLLEREFPVERRLLYLNHAAVAPWPRRTAEAVQRFAGECAENGAQHYAEWLKTEALLREQLRALINARSTADIALSKNTSEALSFVAHGLAWSGGDNVVVPDEEFPSNRIVWESLARYGVGVRPVALGATADPEAALMAAVDGNTRLLSVSSVQYASGLRLDLARLGQFCRSKSIAFCVDAIQGLGVVAHDVQAMHIDFLMADGHKWLLGPEGIALFYCAPQWRERLALHEFGWHMVEHHQDYDRRDWRPADSARRFECGSPNMPGIHALSASLSLLLEIGIARVERRVLERAALLFDLIARHAELELITRTDPGRYAGIVSFRHVRIPSPLVLRHLQAHGVVCAQRGGGIRFSPHCYNRLETLRQAVALCVNPPGPP